MRIALPAKTFLVGEYLALSAGPAIVLDTEPCFEIHSCDLPGLHGIHPESPAGKWWAQQLPIKNGLTWVDPYNSLGGMGASSAQFLGVYLARHARKDLRTLDMLNAYIKASYSGLGTAPSGYDVLAQNASGCVYIDEQKNTTCYTWPFDDISFILAHTGKKLATHHHLENFSALKQVKSLTKIVHATQQAFAKKQSNLLVASVNAYYHILYDLGLVAQHTSEIIEQLKSEPDLLAAKGCGAMGSDIILLIIPRNSLEKWKNNIIPNCLNYIADTNSLYLNNTHKIT